MQSRLESGSGGESGFYGSQFLVLPVARENGLVLFVIMFSVIANVKLDMYIHIQVYVVGVVCMVLVASNLCMSHEARGGHCHALLFFFFLAYNSFFCVLEGTYLLYIHIHIFHVAFLLVGCC